MVITRSAQLIAAVLCVGGALRMVRGASAHPSVSYSGWSEPGSLGSLSRGTPTYHGVLTFSTPGNGDPFSPTVVQELDLGSGQVGVRFNGLDASRNASGEMAFLQRLSGGFYGAHGVVVVDARGVPGAPIYVCKEFAFVDNRVCATPKLSPNGRLVAYVAVGEGTVCMGNYGMHWGASVIVANRQGGEVTRFEGYGEPEWLPDGRLLLMGTMCRNAGVWVADAALHDPARVDGGQVATPGAAPAVSPDGRRLAFVWNNQLWALTLTGKPELSQLTRLPKSVSAGAWSPDGSSLAVLQYDVSMPVRSVTLFRPGDQSSVVERQLTVYPYGPISWR